MSELAKQIIEEVLNMVPRSLPIDSEALQEVMGDAEVAIDILLRRAPQPDALVEALKQALKEAIAFARRAADWYGPDPNVEVWETTLCSVERGKERAPERTYSAEEVREAFEQGAMATTGHGYPLTKTEARVQALLRYPSGERKDEEAGK